jgi:type I restriction enzyme S subunit
MNVPRLRFKEFSGEWEAKTLGDVSENVMYGMNAAAIAYDGTNKYIRITDIDDESRAFKPSPLSSPSGEIDDKFKLKKGDLVFTRTGASVGKSYLYKVEDGNLLFAGFLIKFSITKAHPYFVFLKTLTQCYNGWITVMSMRSGQPGVNAEEFKEFKFNFPTFPEQTKIANFFTAVDEKIAQLTQKGDLLARYKKGVMQQIFSQQLRFKDDDGREFPDWEDESLDNILNYEQPTKYLVSSTDYDDKNKTPVLTAGKTFVLGYTNEMSGIYEEGLPIIIFDDFTTAFKFVTFPFKAKSSAMKILKLKSTENNIKYIFEAMNLINFTSGDEHKRYWISEYSRITIPLPCLKEQTKIANFLTALDDKINHNQNQLNALKRYKQGLLQQLFV